MKRKWVLWEEGDSYAYRLLWSAGFILFAAVMLSLAAIFVAAAVGVWMGILE